MAARPLFTSWEEKRHWLSEEIARTQHNAQQHEHLNRWRLAERAEIRRDNLQRELDLMLDDMQHSPA